MKKAIVLLGTNLGDKLDNLRLAEQLITDLTPVLTRSAVYESPAWGYESTESYYNQALEIGVQTDLDALMERFLDVEAAMGRMREGEGYTDRIIDIDILAVEQHVQHTDVLVCPHPRLHERRFALEPMSELWPDWVHPKLNMSVKELLSQITVNQQVVTKFVASE